MNHRKRKKSRENLRARIGKYCGQLNEDDNIDPREYFMARSNLQNFDRKTMQLCRQVEQALSYGLSGNEDEDNCMLDYLQVVSVTPAPDASRLLVTLQADQTKDYDHDQACLDLEEHKGRLRCEVAACITRKRTPLLVFNVLNFNRLEGAED